MLTVEILRGVVAGGASRKPGDRVDVYEAEARFLVAGGRAKLIEATLPVVIEDPLPEKVSARRRRKPKSEAAPASSAIIETSDAPLDPAAG